MPAILAHTFDHECSHYSEQFTTPRHHGPTHSLVWCLGLAVAVYVANSAVDGEPAGSLLALAVLAGSLSHVLADGLTVAGVPLWWPFRRRRSVFLGALAFRTRSWAEVLVVLGVVAGVGWWVAGWPLGVPTGRFDQYRSSSGLTSAG
jgi:membrane-bound metal-dependent hydrolase YbcI (DUF457 family)